MIAGELNPRAMLGAVTKLRSEIRKEVNAAYYDELLRINGLLIEFEGGEADLAAFVHQYHSRVWQAGFSIRLRCAEQVGTLALVCELPKPVISLQDIQCPFMHFVSDSDCRFADLIGNDAVISQIKGLVSTLNESCSSFHYVNISIGHTLLVGPPGTGKTLTARQIGVILGAAENSDMYVRYHATQLLMRLLSVAAARTASATRDDSSAAWSASDVKLRHAGSKRANGAGGSRRSSRQREIGWSK